MTFVRFLSRILPQNNITLLGTNLFQRQTNLRTLCVLIFRYVRLCTIIMLQCAVSDSPGLVDFSIGLVNSVFNLPDGQVMFFEEVK